MRVVIRSLLIVSLVALPFFAFGESAAGADNPVRVGWIGSMSGPAARWGAYQSAQLAQEHVNAAGGINGRKLELIFEDGRTQGNSAVSAYQKLTGVDKVKFILGGHCTPESLPIAPLAERDHVIMIAAITTTPKLSDAGDYIFRVSPVSLQLADLLAPYARGMDKLEKMGVIYEETDYVAPVAERFKENFEKSGGSIVGIQGYQSGETDFRSLISKMIGAKAEGLYMGVQAPDTAVLIMRQIKQLGYKRKIFSNEQFAGAVVSVSNPEDKALFKPRHRNLLIISNKSELSDLEWRCRKIPANVEERLLMELDLGLHERLWPGRLRSGPSPQGD